MSSDTAIRVENLSKRYQIYDKPHDRLKQSIYPSLQRTFGRKPAQYFREFWALKNVSFEIKKGETVGIIGRNGGGKSTLLQLICGTLNPTSGQLSTFGRVAALLELGSGFNAEFTGRENVYMNAVLLGLKKSETDKRFNDIVQFADIGEFIEQPVKTYSSGMMVRLAFAVIAHVDADILVIDEALAVGDAFFTQKCMRFLREFMKTGTVLFVSHDTSAVVSLCSKAILLDHGAVSMIGTPKEVSEQYLLKLYETTQNVNGSQSEPQAERQVKKFDSMDYYDSRKELIDSSNLRNDIEVFRFETSVETGFGTGGAEILSVRLNDSLGTPLSWVVGGEDVSLEVTCVAKMRLLSPIVGFQFKDHLGQIIFADNTFLSYQFAMPVVEFGKRISAEFHFKLPMLPAGDYSITAAIAEGSQNDHVQLHWRHDALTLRVHASAVGQGLVGVCMRKITLNN